MSRRNTATRNDERLDAVFFALADSTRRRIVTLLSRGPSSVGELAAPFTISLAAVSKHIDVLEDAGIVGRRRNGRFQRCELDPRALDEVSSFVEYYRSFWTSTLDELAEYLEGAESKKNSAQPSSSRRTKKGPR